MKFENCRIAHTRKRIDDELANGYLIACGNRERLFVAGRIHVGEGATRD